MNPLPLLGARAPARDPSALARSVLAQPRFRMEVARPAARTWWDAVRDWLADRWHQFVQAFSQHVHLGAKTGAVLGDLLIAASAGLVVAFGVRLLMNLARERAPAGAGGTPLPLRADAGALYGRALQAAHAQSYAAAVALLFRAALAQLDARGVLREDPARTVNECRRDVRARAPWLDENFERIARGFTAAVYAEDRVTPEQWAAVRGAYERLASAGGDAA